MKRSAGSESEAYEALASSEDYRERALAGVALARLIGDPRLDATLLRLLADQGNTAVSSAVAASLMDSHKVLATKLIMQALSSAIRDDDEQTANQLVDAVYTCSSSAEWAVMIRLISEITQEDPSLEASARLLLGALIATEGAVGSASQVRPPPGLGPLAPDDPASDDAKVVMSAVSLTLEEDLGKAEAQLVAVLLNGATPLSSRVARVLLERHDSTGMGILATAWGFANDQQRTYLKKSLFDCTMGFPQWAKSIRDSFRIAQTQPNDGPAWGVFKYLASVPASVHAFETIRESRIDLGLVEDG